MTLLSWIFRRSLSLRTVRRYFVIITVACVLLALSFAWAGDGASMLLFAAFAVITAFATGYTQILDLREEVLSLELQLGQLAKEVYEQR
jgi:uncharacterized membrane protein